MPTVFYDLMSSGEMEGFRRQQRTVREAAVAAAAGLVADVMTGRAPSYMFQEALMPSSPQALAYVRSNYPGVVTVREAMTVSDFPYLLGDVLDRMMLARYREQPQTWRQYMKVSRSLRDFRKVERLTMDGLESTYDETPEEGEVQYGSLSEDKKSYSPAKYTKAAKLSFEAIVNDDLSAFDDIPDRLGRGGRRTLHKFTTGLYVDANGPHASFFTSGNGNLLSGNPAFSIAGLQAALTHFLTMTDTGGDPIAMEGVTLVYGPALEIPVMNVMNQLTVDVSVDGGDSTRVMRVNNWTSRRVTPVMDPYIPVVASSANGATSWFLFANPDQGRPAIEVGFLRGFEEPQLYQKLANTTRVGGGIDQMAGDFATMSQEYKGVIAFGGAQMDPKGAVASNGSGS